MVPSGSDDALPSKEHDDSTQNGLIDAAGGRLTLGSASVTSDKLALAHELAALGEQSRVMPRVPLKMVITDRKSALIPLTLSPQQEAVVLHPSALLDGLIGLFELLWQQAAPLWRPRRRNPGLSKADEELLMLCSLGLTDQAIARRLAVAQRTVERRMRRIMDELGAKTRFQAGMQAAWRSRADFALREPAPRPTVLTDAVKPDSKLQG